MNSQQLLYINLGIGLFFVLYFFFFRTKPKQPTKLNLRAKSSTDIESTVVETQEHERDAKVAQVLGEIESKSTPNLVEEKPAALEPEVAWPPPSSETPALAKKDFSIFFVYNAHEWESHDVLGVPRDCSLQQATETYQRLIKTSDPSTFEFYEAAFQAILKRKGSQ